MSSTKQSFEFFMRAQALIILDLVGNAIAFQKAARRVLVSLRLGSAQSVQNQCPQKDRCGKRVWPGQVLSDTGQEIPTVSIPFLRFVQYQLCRSFFVFVGSFNEKRQRLMDVFKAASMI